QPTFSSPSHLHSLSPRPDQTSAAPTSQPRIHTSTAPPPRGPADVVTPPRLQLGSSKPAWSSTSATQPHTHSLSILSFHIFLESIWGFFKFVNQFFLPIFGSRFCVTLS
ncbi:hypothetical protein TorRG33x02_290820, partial [Trema orientale]